MALLHNEPVGGARGQCELEAQRPPPPRSSPPGDAAPAPATAPADARRRRRRRGSSGRWRASAPAAASESRTVAPRRVADQVCHGGTRTRRRRNPGQRGGRHGRVRNAGKIPARRAGAAGSPSNRPRGPTSREPVGVRDRDAADQVGGARRCRSPARHAVHHRRTLGEADQEHGTLGHRAIRSVTSERVVRTPSTIGSRQARSPGFEIARRVLSSARRCAGGPQTRGAWSAERGRPRPNARSPSPGRPLGVRRCRRWSRTCGRPTAAGRCRRDRPPARPGTRRAAVRRRRSSARRWVRRARRPRGDGDGDHEGDGHGHGPGDRAPVPQR